MWNEPFESASPAMKRRGSGHRHARWATGTRSQLYRRES